MQNRLIEILKVNSGIVLLLLNRCFLSHTTSSFSCVYIKHKLIISSSSILSSHRRHFSGVKNNICLTTTAICVCCKTKASRDSISLNIMKNDGKINVVGLLILIQLFRKNDLPSDFEFTLFKHFQYRMENFLKDILIKWKIMKS